MDRSSECDKATAGDVKASTMARYFDTSSRRPLCSVLFPEAVNVVLSGAVLYASASLSLAGVCLCHNGVQWKSVTFIFCLVENHEINGISENLCICLKVFNSSSLK